MNTCVCLRMGDLIQHHFFLICCLKGKAIPGLEKLHSHQTRSNLKRRGLKTVIGYLKSLDYVAQRAWRFWNPYDTSLHGNQNEVGLICLFVRNELSIYPQQRNNDATYPKD